MGNTFLKAVDALSDVTSNVSSKEEVSKDAISVLPFSIDQTNCMINPFKNSLIIHKLIDLSIC